MESKSAPRVPRAGIGRRRFLLLAGGAVGATALGGMSVANSYQPVISFVESEYGEDKAVNERILVAYASKTGATSGVADALGKQLAAGGARVDVRPMKEVQDLGVYQAAVLGSAINGGKWLPEAMRFVEANQAQLNRMPTAIFLVCLTLAKKNSEQDRRGIETWMDPVKALVKPVATGLFAGTLQYSNHSFFEGLGMHIFAATLSLGEGDYRDWDAIRAWADSTRPLLVR